MSPQQFWCFWWCHSRQFPLRFFVKYLSTFCHHHRSLYPPHLGPNKKQDYYFCLPELRLLWPPLASLINSTLVVSVSGPVRSMFPVQILFQAHKGVIIDRSTDAHSPLDTFGQTHNQSCDPWAEPQPPDSTVWTTTPTILSCRLEVMTWTTCGPSSVCLRTERHGCWFGITQSALHVGQIKMS